MVIGGKYVDHDLKTSAEWQAKVQNDLAWAAGVKALVWEMAGGHGLLLTNQYLGYDDRKVE
ncbi:hypothetical protein DFAR_1690008 [Desulfarculales bacterium]